ncbi:MAG: guanylate kinase, partial [Verrucomicrobia bacterium]
MTAENPTPVPNRRPVLLLVTGPSGSGKTTVVRCMLERLPGLARVVTCTTRPPRPGEQDGVDYHFLKPEEFERRLREGDLLEHATVYGHGYGTPRSGLVRQLEAGQDLLLNLDVQGTLTLRRLAREDRLLGDCLVTVFLTPGRREELERRLRGRGTDPEEAIARRLAVAREELRYATECDYLVWSGTIEEDYRRVAAIYEAERWRRHRVPLP